MSRYPNDIINGREVPRLVVRADHVLTGVHIGGVHAEKGHFELRGTLQGSLAIHPGATATIVGRQQGSVHLGESVSVEELGAIEGSVHIEAGAKLVVEPGAKLAGSLHNDGLVLLRGVFGGSQSGQGELLLEGQGRVKQPRIVNGARYYDWS